MSINILFLLQTYGTGGSERLVLNLCKGINKDMFKPFVISLTGGILQKEFQKNGFTPICLNKGKGIDFTAIKKIRKLINHNEIDIINAHHFSPFIHGFLGSVLTKCKIIYTDHTVEEIEDTNLFWQIAGTFFLKFSYGAIGISHSVANKMKEKFSVNPDKVYTILNAVDLEKFDIIINKTMKRKEIGLKQEDKVIGIVGNLREQKNHKNIIRAFYLIKKKISNSKLVVVGEGEKEEELKNEVEKVGIKNDVMFLGSRLDVHEIYHIFDVYCLCSHYEGLPLTILEAMCCKIPIIGTNVNGIKDVIKNNHNGILVKPDNPEKLAEVIVKILKNSSLSKDLSDHAYKYVIENHDIKGWLKKYDDLFKTMNA